MFKVLNQNQPDRQGQVPADLPIHTMKKDLEEIEHPSEFKKDEPETQEKYILSDAQKSSPFLSSAPQPKQVPTSIKFKDEASEQRINEDKLARQQAEEKRVAEQKAEMARKIAEEGRMAEQKATEQRSMEERRGFELKAEEERRLAEQKAMEERLVKQKEAMAQKMAEENAARERKIAEQRAMEERKITEQKAAIVAAPITPAPTKVVPQINTNADKIKIFGKTGDTSKSKNVISYIVITILILSLAGGAYYFWVTRQQGISVIENTLVEVPEPEPIPEPTATFSVDKPNYLIINQVNATAGEIKTALKNYADDVFKSGIATPIEFVIVDTRNNPIIFSTFANSLGLTLSPAVMSNLKDTFSLFIYNDQGNIRLGLTIDSKNDPVLKVAMSTEEKAIIGKISPLFMDVIFTNPTNIFFNKNIYNETELRYINLISSKPLSVDYAVSNKKLLLGTSKMTMFSIVDYIKNSDIDTTR